MGSRVLVQKGLDEKPSNDSKAVIFIIPENLPDLECSTSTSNDSCRDLNHLGKEIASNDAMVRDLSVIKSDEDEEASCVIDVKCADGEESVEKICRICHLDSDLQESEGDPKIKMEFIELGCSCKGELGYSHSSCAATWFHHKGNRQCEICGKTAENVTLTVVNHRFMEQWNENRINGEEAQLSERNTRCWQGQPCCNLLLACLVMSFVIPWLLRIDMF